MVVQCNISHISYHGRDDSNSASPRTRIIDDSFEFGKASHGFETSPDNEENYASGRKRPGRNAGRRPRVNFPEDQVAEMEELYQQNNYLSAEDRIHMAKSLGVTEYRITVWFQNRRSKDKRAGIEPVLSTETHPTVKRTRPSNVQDEQTNFWQHRPSNVQQMSSETPKTPDACPWGLSSNLNPNNFILPTAAFETDIDSFENTSSEDYETAETQLYDDDDEDFMSTSPSYEADAFAHNDHVWPVVVKIFLMLESTTIYVVLILCLRPKFTQYFKQKHTYFTKQQG